MNWNLRVHLLPWLHQYWWPPLPDGVDPCPVLLYHHQAPQWNSTLDSKVTCFLEQTSGLRWPGLEEWNISSINCAKMSSFVCILHFLKVISLQRTCSSWFTQGYHDLYRQIFLTSNLWHPAVEVLAPSLPEGLGFLLYIVHSIPCNQRCNINDNKRGYKIYLYKVKES